MKPQTADFLEAAQEALAQAKQTAPFPFRPKPRALPITHNFTPPSGLCQSK
jgi:hypothetical protein